MNQFVFSGRTKTTLLAFMAIGAICLGMSWFAGDHLHSRFWSNLLHNAVFFTGISFMALFFIAVCITAYAGWATLFKRVWEAFSLFLIPGFILMIILAVSTYFGANHLYHWNDAASVATDEILNHKKGFLNKNWYMLSTLLIVGAWTFFAVKMRKVSLDEDVNGGDSGFSHHQTLRKYSAAFLPIAGFSSAAVIWQWIMSIDAHWYSTLFAWYATASWFVAMMALTILVLLFLKANGYYENVTADHMHDLGKFLFGFSVFWMYLWFSQYMLIWYGNVGEETGYFKLREEEYPILFYGNLVINFVLPFFVLMRNDTKRKFGSLGLVAILVFVGHWWDYFLMIKPGVLHTSHAVAGHGHDHGHAAEGAAHGAEHASHFVSGFSLPGLLEFGTMLGFLGLFLFVALTALSKAPLVAKNDPYLEESLHHHVV